MFKYFYYNIQKINIEQISNIVMTWNRKPTREEIVRGLYKKNDNVVLYYDFTDGKYIEEPKPNSKIINSGNFETAIYYQVIDNMLNISLYKIDTSRPKIPNEKRSWEFVSTFFINKNKECYVKAPSKEFLEFRDFPSNLEIKKNDEVLFIEIPAHELAWRSFDMSKHKNINYIEDELNDENLFHILKEIFGEYFKSGKFNVCLLNNMSNLDLFINLKDSPKTTGNSQKIIDDLISYKTKNIRLPKIKKNTASEKIATIEKLENNICCIRIYTPLFNEKININKYVEVCRLFIKNDKLISCRPNNNDEFVPLRGSLSNDDFKFTLINYKDETVEGTSLKYLAKIMNDFDKSMHGFILWTFIKWPILEKFYNAGFEELIAGLIKNESLNGNMNQELERIFGKIHNKKALLKCLGVNKYQFNKIKEFEDYSFYYSKGYDYKKRRTQGVLCVVKILMCSNDISSIDNETFDNIFNIATEIYNILKTSNDYSLRNNVKIISDLLKSVNILYSVKAEINVAPVLLSYKKEEVIGWPFYANTLYLYRDYLEMVKRIHGTSDFKPYFKTHEELRTMHDMAVEVYNIMSVEYKKEAFKEVSSRWDKFCYEDDEYAVIAPKEPADLAKEGLELHHCVKGYIDRVIDKKTNIVFIRKKQEIDKPFFTVEITNDNTIQQIHGFANRNLSTEPELIDFVNKWIKERDLKASNFDKVR